MIAPLPSDEAARIAALREYQILDSLPETPYDDITFLATQICRTPIGLITFVDGERQWFKSKLGVPIAATPRDIAFCSHTILQSDLFVVPDALADERFATNPLVSSEPHIRFYAGAPLLTPRGLRLGALCVIDRVPRILTPEQAEALRALGRQVVALLELRRNVDALSRTVAERERARAQLRESFAQTASNQEEPRRPVGEKALFQDLVGTSQAMQLVHQQIREIAAVDATVVIEGDTGTGKELVARAIHLASHRRNDPLVALNCAGLTDSLLGSQLFGHTRGAFTGAIADHKGLFEAANGGTLFLDEIGDIPLNMQTALLRVLQEGEIVRLGESRPRKIDVRVLTATHHNLSDDAAKGTFRADLLYRIRVARIQLPPLRERREDIPLLARLFLAQVRTTNRQTVPEVGVDAMRLLLTYPWPGNVRELKSAMTFATIRCTGPVIEPSHLPEEIRGSAALRAAPAGSATTDRPRILAALHVANGNRPAAARLLGISRATLYRRLAALGILPPSRLM